MFGCFQVLAGFGVWTHTPLQALTHYFYIAVLNSVVKNVRTSTHPSMGEARERERERRERERERERETNRQRERESERMRV